MANCFLIIVLLHVPNAMYRVWQVYCVSLNEEVLERG